MALLFKNARVLDPGSGTDAVMDLLVSGDKIEEMGKGIPDSKARDSAPSFGPAEVIDCAGKLLVPGLIDMHCHLREPGFEYKETIESGSRAGAAGGYTALVCMAN